MTLLDAIRAYYDACNSGDADRIAACFTDDAVHYYTRMAPHRGAKAIAEATAQAVEHAAGYWEMRRGIEQGDEACIEWTMTYRDPRTGEEGLTYGTEWFLFSGGRIAEVRAYFHGSERNPTGALIGLE